MDIEKLKEIASQLKNPHGDQGIEMGDMMNETNRSMTLHALHFLGLANEEKVLELGYGNGKHLPILFENTPQINYYGLDISPLMHQQAIINNKDLMERFSIDFQLYNGDIIPFSDAFFDKIFTVNTIYFWENPQQFMLQLYQILKPDGSLVITFIEKRFMEKLPFAQYGFTKYGFDEIIQLTENLNFKVLHYETKKDWIYSKSGDWVEREFSSIKLKKETI